MDIFSLCLFSKFINFESMSTARIYKNHKHHTDTAFVYNKVIHTMLVEVIFLIERFDL